LLRRDKEKLSRGKKIRKKEGGSQIRLGGGEERDRKETAENMCEEEINESKHQTNTPQKNKNTTNNKKNEED